MASIASPETPPSPPLQQSILLPAPALSSSRYNRQLLVPQLGGITGQQNLLNARVLIVGLGGLGSPAALYLAGAGIGTLGLMDSDSVEASNLHRQIAHSEAAAATGAPKVTSALESCRALNSSIEYRAYEMRATPEQFLNVLQEGRFETVLDCTDNPATRYLISDACVVAGCVLVSGAAQKGEGQVVVLNCPPVQRELEGEEKGPCYRCVFPRPPAPEMVRGCSEIGIFGHVVGVIGVLMAGEAVKIISQGKHLPRPSDPATNPEVGGRSSHDTQNQQLNHTYSPSSPLKAKPGPAPKQQHTMLLYNTFATDPRHQFRTIILRGRRKDCLACGDDEILASKNLTRITAESILQGRVDYVAFCGLLEDVRVLGDENRIDAKEFLELPHYESAKRHRNRHGHEGIANHRRKRPLVVDVREEHEVELGPKLKGSVNIPLSRILRHGGRAFDDLHALSVGLDTDSLRDTPTNGLPEGRQGGMVDPETQVLQISHPTQGGMVDQERHIPDVERRGLAAGGGMVDQESHIPTAVGGCDAYSQQLLGGEFSGEGQGNEYDGLENGGGGGGGGEDANTDDDDDGNAGWPVYFVCQRGNDSQLAAQTLLERIRAESASSNTPTNRSHWGWVGDVRGGFLAMEKHQFGEFS
ncbi:uncharacterized protein A1O9_10175 [Exophiala aquamarina CBS 119918]|uniref:Rhodanese domain-containing protein n=1 Tax=Exophiala aquamarina CBS 119918 TaxID=1182545 RepID=A0A072P0Z3_9EURO|nr:uncharacterized protein A1O9_10175 [Exophiala aquamarina CBS 119918]KEF53774.1 hypothetical protein A1O9_10175 [Exophiala aquamarina CBS 119918]